MNLFLTILLFGSLALSHAQNRSALLFSKAKESVNNQSNIATNNSTGKYQKKKDEGTSSVSIDIKTLEGSWKVDGVIVTTENEALKPQITLQEEQYNAVYKGSIWIFKKDGAIAITMPRTASSPGGNASGKYELRGEKILIEINSQPSEYDLKFENGQMLLINISPLNTLYYVFVRA